MVNQLWMTFIGVITGAVGYWIATFWIKPILRYREIRQQILADLIFFSDAVIAEGMGERIIKKRLQRIDFNRRSSSDLYSCLESLPFWYTFWLKFRKIDVEMAARNLIGYSNTPNYDDASKRVIAIKSALRFKVDVV